MVPPTTYCFAQQRQKYFMNLILQRLNIQHPHLFTIYYTAVSYISLYNVVFILHMSTPVMYMLMFMVKTSKMKNKQTHAVEIKRQRKGKYGMHRQSRGPGNNGHTRHETNKR
jgi:hypothetical protein